MRHFILLGVLSLTACKTIETTINQTGTGNTATTTAAQEPGPVATGVGATAVEANKPEAPVQAGTGNQQQATDNTKAGQRNGSAATAPGATSSTTSTKNGTPFWVWLLVFAGGFATRQFGPWVLRQVVPGLKLWPT